MKINIFNAGIGPDLMEEFNKIIGDNAPVPNVLNSYYYADGNISRLLEMKENNKIGHFYFDSGAYSFKNGQLVKNDTESEKFLDGFIGYCNEFGDIFDAYFSLDNSFNDPEHNLRYFLRMKKALADKRNKPVPVLHARGKKMLDEFRLYVELGCPHVAIGSNVRISDSKIWDEFQNIRRKKDIKIHLFGTIHERKIEHLMMVKPDSCDSGKVFMAAKFGFLLYLKENPETKGCMMERIYLESKDITPDGAKPFSKYIVENEDFRQYLEGLKIDHGMLLENPTLIHIVNLHQVCLYEKYLNEVLIPNYKKD